MKYDKFTIENMAQEAKETWNLKFSVEKHTKKPLNEK